jgi:hypothetical protein
MQWTTDGDLQRLKLHQHCRQSRPSCWNAKDPPREGPPWVQSRDLLTFSYAVRLCTATVSGSRLLPTTISDTW